MPAAQSPRALFPQSVVGLTVQQNGQLSPVPSRFGVGSNEIVLWVVGNKSGHPITVRLQNFLVNNAPVDPFVWLASDSVQIANGQMGFIAGIKNSAYQQRVLVDRVKYTIHVEATNNAFPAVDHDPDGDIKP